MTSAWGGAERELLAFSTANRWKCAINVWFWAVGRYINPHLSKKIDASSNYEGRDGRADHSKERDGANVLEEVSLDIQTHTFTQLDYSELVAGILSYTLLHNMQPLKRSSVQVQHCASSTGLEILMTYAKTAVYPIIRINLPYLVERVSRLKDDGW